LGDHVPIVVRPDPEPQQFLGLRQSPAAQFVDREGRQGDRSRLAAFGLLFPDRAGVGLLGARDYSQLPVRKVDRPPAEGGDLTAA
jgi:hypothetical protein